MNLFPSLNLGHVIDHELSADDKDVKREIRNLFMRSNILIRRYSKCSTAGKLLLFKAYCLCLYDVGIWRNYSVIVFNKLRSGFNKFVEMFFGYDRRYSVTQMLTELNLPCFDNFIAEIVNNFNARWVASSNHLVTHLCALQL